MNEEQKQQLLSFLAGAGVSEDDRSFWIPRLERVSLEACKKVIDFFTSFPHEMGNLRALQEKREKALSADDSVAWEQFCKEEEEYFAKFLVASS